MLSRCFLDFSVGVRASVIGLSQISSFSLYIIIPNKKLGSQLSCKSPSFTNMDIVELQTFDNLL